MIRNLYFIASICLLGCNQVEQESSGDPLWPPGAELARELPVRPGMQRAAERDDSAAKVLKSSSINTESALLNSCIPTPEIACDGIDHDCDQRDVCDTNADGVLEYYEPGETQHRRALHTL